MKLMRVLVMSVALAAAVPSMSGCSLFQPDPTPSSQVLAELRVAKTAYLTAITIVNLKSDGKPSKDAILAEQLVFSYIQAAEEAAAKGDVVSVEQKLDLFNDALLKFNEQFVNTQ